MRKLAPLLAFAAFACLVLSQPAAALDDPAFADGGSVCTTLDAGPATACDTGRTGSWNMAVRCVDRTYYKMCESNLALIAVAPDGGGGLTADGGLLYDGGQNQSQGTCSATTINQLLDSDRTFDVFVPSNRRWIAFNQQDGGFLNCSVQVVTP